MSRRSRRKSTLTTQKAYRRAACSADQKSRYHRFGSCFGHSRRGGDPVSRFRRQKDDALASFEKKAELLREQVLSDARLDEISGDIEVGLPDNVVFLSVCSGEERAKVFTGTGVDRKAAWLSAYDQAKSFIEEENYNAVWLKADLMSEAKHTTRSNFQPSCTTTGPSFQIRHSL